MKKIIVPTDFSECANNAFKAAIQIAKKHNAVITLLHVYERPIYGHMYYVINSKEETKLKDFINVEMNKIIEKNDLKGVQVNKLFLNDINVWEMVNDINLEDADLIVMGTHGVNGLREIFIGSNTEKVARIAKCPVLSYRNSFNKFEPEHIVFASDFSEIIDQRAFQQIREVLSHFNPKFHLLRVTTPKNFEDTDCVRIRMNKFVSDNHLNNYTINIYNYPSVKGGIIKFTDEVNADLIALATHGKTGTSHIIHGSITEDVLNHTPKPVLSINTNFNILLNNLKTEMEATVL